MDLALNIYDELNNRELSILIWLVIFLKFFVFNDKSIQKLAKVFFVKHILIITFCFLGYVFLETYLLKSIGLWLKSSYKDVFWWIFFTGIFTIGDYNKIKDKNPYFVGILKSFLKFTIVLEFILQLNTFHFIVEFFILVPLATLLSIFIVVLSDSKNENKENLITLFGTFSTFLIALLIIFSLVTFYQNFPQINLIEKITEFIFPIFLSILFVPFIYLLWYYSRIENLMSINKRFFIHPKPSFILLLKVSFILKFNLKNIERWKDQALRFSLSNSKDLILEARKINITIQGEKFRISVPLIKGWGIKNAREFLLDYDLKVGDYKEYIQNGLEWYACSKYRNLDGEILQNNIAFHLSGNEFIVSELKIITHFYTKYNKDEPSMTIFLEASQTLFRKAFVMNMEKALLEKLKNSIPFKIVILDKIVSFEKDIWSTSLGYHLTFCIKNNLETNS